MASNQLIKRLFPLLRRLSLLYLLILIVLLAETFYIFTRGVDTGIETRAEAAYPVTSIHYNQQSLELLGALQPGAATPPASGKANPFTP